MNNLATYIELKDKLFTDRTVCDLRSMALSDLLVSMTPLWYLSQTEGSAGHLISKIIDAKLTAEEEVFADGVIAELPEADSELHQQALTELGRRARIRRRTVETPSIHAANRLAPIFIDAFCTKSYVIDWTKLVRFVDDHVA